MLNIKNVFKKPKYHIIQPGLAQEPENAKQALPAPAVPDGLFIKCEGCGEAAYNKDFSAGAKICAKCGHHHRLNARERIELIMDTGTFREINANLLSVNPLEFPGYEQKLADSQEASDLTEAVVTGYGKIHGADAVIAVMDSHFMMGSMGSVVGEKVARAFEYATAKKFPVIVFTASGGARMQEGMFSLMQMAKTSAAISRHDQAGGLYIVVLTDPTTGGVTASLAMLGDLTLSEPGALIGFAGQRVIEQTIKQQLPEGFQTAEFLLEHGFVDKIVPRDTLKITLSRLIKLHQR